MKYKIILKLYLSRPMVTLESYTPSMFQHHLDLIPYPFLFYQQQHSLVLLEPPTLFFLFAPSGYAKRWVLLMFSVDLDLHLTT